MRSVENTSGNCLTHWRYDFGRKRWSQLKSKMELCGWYPGLHMAPQSGVPLEYIKCITFSQRAGWGPSHSIWPPVLLSFSVTKPPSSLQTVPVLASLALASHSRGGGSVEIPGDSHNDNNAASSFYPQSPVLGLKRKWYKKSKTYFRLFSDCTRWINIKQNFPQFYNSLGQLVITSFQNPTDFI